MGRSTAAAIGGIVDPAGDGASGTDRVAGGPLTAMTALPLAPDSGNDLF
jgi:hypothetical protein